MSFLDSLPDHDERYDKPGALLKGKTRLQERIEERPLTKVDEKTFRAEVWKRDKSHCRWCLRKVEKVLGRVPQRGEVNHIHGRGKDLRYKVKAAILLCLECHEKFTGRVNEKWILVPSVTFTMREFEFADATFPVVFKRVV